MHLFYPELCFHFLDQRLKLDLALFLAIGIDVPCDALTVDGRRIPSFPHVLADLVDRACSLPSVLAFIRLKFRPWRGF